MHTGFALTGSLDATCPTSIRTQCLARLTLQLCQGLSSAKFRHKDTPGDRASGRHCSRLHRMRSLARVWNMNSTQNNMHSHHHGPDHAHHSAALEPATLMRDPICGMTVDSSEAEHVMHHDGTDFHFCSARCKDKFEAGPKQYLGPRPEPEPQPEGTQYTCPMHPEVIRDAPGDCPKCGMALEPMGVPAGDDSPNPELVDFTRRFWVSLAFSIPLFVVAMGPMLGLPVHAWLRTQSAAWIELVLASPVVLWAAMPFFQRAYKSIINRSPIMWTLISIGVGVAYVSSVIATLLPDL